MIEFALLFVILIFLVSGLIIIPSMKSDKHDITPAKAEAPSFSSQEIKALFKSLEDRMSGLEKAIEKLKASCESAPAGTAPDPAESMKPFIEQLLSKVAESTDFLKTRIDTFSGQMVRLTKFEEDQFHKLNHNLEFRLNSLKELISGDVKNIKEDLKKALELLEHNDKGKTALMPTDSNQPLKPGMPEGHNLP